MRAILLANATLTSIAGLRPTMSLSHVPCLAPACTFLLMITLLAPMISKRRSDLSPIFVVAPSRCLPPVECCRGTRPNHAAKSRPFWKVSATGYSVAKAVAISGPMPGIVISRLARSSSLARRAISPSSFVISASRWRSDRTRTCRVAIASEGSPQV